MAHAMPATAGLSPAVAPAASTLAAATAGSAAGTPAVLRPVPPPWPQTLPRSTSRARRPAGGHARSRARGGTAQGPAATDSRYGAVVAVALAVALLLLVGAGVRAQPGTADFDVRGAAAAPAAGWTVGIPPAGAAGSPAERQASQGTIVVVRPGDTVWDLARAAAPAGVAVEDYVDDVVVLNDVDPHHLVPGSTLRLP